MPTGAVPGLLFVRVGTDTAVGLVPFLPVDGTGAPLPQPTDTHIFYVAPSRGEGGIGLGSSQFDISPLDFSALRPQ